MATKGNGKVEQQQERKPANPIKPSHPGWKLAEHANNRFRAFVDDSVELEDLESDPRIWTVVAQQLTEFDVVTVVREDRKFWAEVLVVDVQQPAYAKVIVLKSVTPLPARRGENATLLPEGFSIYRDPKTEKFLAIREKDGARLNGDGSDTFELARRALLDHATLKQASAPRYS